MKKLSLIDIKGFIQGHLVDRWQVVQEPTFFGSQSSSDNKRFRKEAEGTSVQYIIIFIIKESVIQCLLH